VLGRQPVGLQLHHPMHNECVYAQLIKKTINPSFAAKYCPGPLLAAPVYIQNGITVNGSATIAESGSIHGMTCYGGQDGQDEGAAVSIPYGQQTPCPWVRVKQLFNAGGEARFELQIFHTTDAINTIGMLISFSNPPISAPTIVSKVITKYCSITYFQAGGVVMETLSSSAFTIELVGINVQPLVQPGHTAILSVRYDPWYGTNCITFLSCEWCQTTNECLSFDFVETYQTVRNSI